MIYIVLFSVWLSLSVTFLVLRTNAKYKSAIAEQQRKKELRYKIKWDNKKNSLAKKAKKEDPVIFIG